jgi:hypothetical protein
MKSHPLAELFPMIDDAELKELAADIKANGLNQPIVTHEGMILDGRHRFRACTLARVNPTFTTFKGRDPLAFVISANLRRRHLTTSQRSAIAAQMATAKVGNHTQGAIGSFDTDCSTSTKPALTNEQAAQAMQVSVPSVKRAKKMLAVATPKEVEAVKAGTATVAQVIKKHEPKPLTQGQQKSDPRLFARLENELGAMLRKIDELHKQFPNGKHHGAAIRLVKDCMTEIEQWQKVKR